MQAAKGHVLRVGKGLEIAVGFIARGEHQAPKRAVMARRFEDVPGAFDVRLESGNRMAIPDRDDCLRAQVIADVDLVLVQSASDVVQVLQAAAHAGDPLLQAQEVEVGVRDVVANETDDAMALVDEGLGQPSPEDARGAGDEDVHFQTTQGRLPSAHILFRRSTSLNVSMAIQKSRCSKTASWPSEASFRSGSSSSGAES